MGLGGLDDSRVATRILMRMEPGGSRDHTENVAAAAAAALSVFQLRLTASGRTMLVTMLHLSVLTLPYFTSVSKINSWFHSISPSDASLLTRARTWLHICEGTFSNSFTVCVFASQQVKEVSNEPIRSLQRERAACWLYVRVGLKLATASTCPSRLRPPSEGDVSVRPTCSRKFPS